MKYSIFLFWIAFILGVTHANDFAQFEILKEERWESIYQNDAYIPLMDITWATQTLQELTRSYEQVEAEIKDIQERKQETDKHFDAAKISIHRTLQDISKHQNDIIDTQKIITLTLNKIRSWEADIQDMQNQLWDMKWYISTYSRMLYKITNDFYLTDAELSDIKLLTKTDNIAEIFGKDDLTSLLQEELQELFGKMNSIHVLQRKRVLSLQADIANFTKNIQEYRAKLHVLEQQQDHIEELLEYLQQDREFAQMQFDKVHSSKDVLDKQKDRLEKITDSTKNFIWRNTDVQELLSEPDRKDGSKYFSWPIRLVESIEDLETIGYKKDADGIVIDAKQDEAVYAPAPWIVYMAHTTEWSALQWIVLLHKHGYITVIMPLSDIFVKQWDVVRRWEILGRAWWTPWTDWAGLESTSAHIYLEILKNSEAISPYDVLDTSIFQSKDALDILHQLKWKQDYLDRDVDLSDLPILEGESVEQRRNYFLSKTWWWTFSDPNIRLDAAEWTWIDPIFGICLGAAETSYKNFKSGNNIGNVGNDDSGNTRTFNTPTAGVRAIFNTFNNSYLWHHNTMDQLSRYGNKHGYIYASSSINRQTNIMRCLSMIYDTNIPEDYFFRIEK